MASKLSLLPPLMNAYVVLLKVDSVRRIDHVIDYFGELLRAGAEPRASRQQAMLYGIIAGGTALKEVTRRGPVDEPPPLAENSKLKSIGKPIPWLDAVPGPWRRYHP